MQVKNVTGKIKCSMSKRAYMEKRSLVNIIFIILMMVHLSPKARSLDNYIPDSHPTPASDNSYNASDMKFFPSIGLFLIVTRKIQWLNPPSLLGTSLSEV